MARKLLEVGEVILGWIVADSRIVKCLTLLNTISEPQS